MSDEHLDELVSRLTLEQKVGLLTGRDSWSLHALPEIGLRSVTFSDGPAGVRGTRWDERDPSISFPSPTAVAASWNTAIVEQVGVAMGQEARRKGVHVLLAPTINVQRSPLAGRHFEAYSEDPLLTAQVATAFVRGVQSQGVAATAKHYVANDSETERFTVDVRVEQRTLREVYLAAFEEPAVSGGVWAVMSAYNSINGVTASEHTLLTSPLREEWLFDGVVVSDWTAVRSLESARHPQDLVMPGPSDVWDAALVRAVRAGDIPESTVDDKVLRILRLAQRVGALDGGPSPTAVGEGAPQEQSTARGACVAGMVLLRNEDLLPLAPPRTVAVIGEGAMHARIQGGGSATVVPQSVISPVDGIRQRWPDAEVRWSLGAVVQQGLAALPPEGMRTPEGAPGLRVSYVGGTGAELAREVRSTSVLVWFGGDPLPEGTEVIELALDYATEDARADGRTSLAFAGVADVDVWAGGEHAGQLRLRTAPGDDPATAVLNPPWGVLDVEARTGVVSLVVRFRPSQGGIPGAMSLRIGTPPPADDADQLIADAVSLAEKADLAVVVVSTSAEVESEGFDRTTLQLPGRQDDLVRAVAKVKPRCVVVVNAGAPVILPWRSDVSTILAVWFPGQCFGSALAAVLAGDDEPRGRLPVTWPGEAAGSPIPSTTPDGGILAYTEGLDVGYRAWQRSGVEPAYCFGHGLGYTSWRVENVTVSPYEADSGVTVEADVSNTGNRDGSTVLQLYLRRVSDSEVERPVRWLVGFAALTVRRGGSQRVRVHVPTRRFAHWTDAGWTVEPGLWRMQVGMSLDDVAALGEVDTTTR